MTLRRHRRNMVIWRSSRCPAYRGRGLWFTRAGRPGRVRRWLRISGLLVAVGLLRVAAVVRPRWRPLVDVDDVPVISDRDHDRIGLLRSALIIWRGQMKSG